MDPVASWPLGLSAAGAAGWGHRPLGLPAGAAGGCRSLGLLAAVAGRWGRWPLGSLGLSAAGAAGCWGRRLGKSGLVVKVDSRFRLFVDRTGLIVKVNFVH